MKALIIGLMLALGSFSLLAPAAASAYNPLDGACASSSASQSSVCQDKDEVKPGDHPITDLITKVTAIIAVVAGIIAVIMIVIAGLRFIMSGGEAQKVAGARNNLVHAIIGLVVIALASTIISIVVGLT